MIRYTLKIKDFYLFFSNKMKNTNEVSFKFKQKLKDKDYNKNTIERII